MAHTATPWSVEVEVDYEDEDEQPHVYVCSSATQCDLTVVATMGEAPSIPLDRKKDDAYLIITAVNSHDRLVEALRLVRMSAVWDYLAGETQEIIAAALEGL